MEIMNESALRSKVRNMVMEALDELDAFHGTTADFNEFDHAYMGSGIGNQAYGYGTYLSTNKEVASGYGSKLYTVEIPDKRKGYIYGDKFLTVTQRDSYRNKLYSYILKIEPESYPDRMSRMDFMNELRSAFEDMDGNSLYGTISSYLGSDKAASEFCYNILKKRGLIYRDKNFDGENIVIFNPKDIKIVSKE